MIKPLKGFQKTSLLSNFVGSNFNLCFQKNKDYIRLNNEHDNCGAGFICSLKGEKTNDIIHKALNILTCLEHRGAVSSDGKTGDGAGILIEIPDDFFQKMNVLLNYQNHQRICCWNGYSFHKKLTKQNFVLMFLKKKLNQTRLINFRLERCANKFKDCWKYCRYKLSHQ